MGSVPGNQTKVDSTIQRKIMNDDVVIECQVCGDEIKRIRGESLAEAQKWRNAIADNPYKYIMFCKDCVSNGYHIEEAYR
jgi:hypothetical protein